MVTDKNHPNLFNFFYLPSTYLIIANCIPIVGVVFFDWSLFQILMVYWMENIVIAFYTILKMVKASSRFMKIPGRSQGGRLTVVFIISFFIIHFGGFVFVHWVFIHVLFGPSSAFFNGQVEIIPLLITFFIFLVSHGISYWQNFIAGGEFNKVSPIDMMLAPYSRIVVMHLTVLAAGFVFAIFSLNRFFRIIIIIIKTVIDYRLHSRQNKKI